MQIRFDLVRNSVTTMTNRMEIAKKTLLSIFKQYEILESR